MTSTRVNRRSERVGGGRSSNARQERGMTAVRIIQFGTIAEEAKEKLRKLDIVNFCFSTLVVKSATRLVLVNYYVSLLCYVCVAK